jgi:GT2 family glycosyltransferase
MTGEAPYDVVILSANAANLVACVGALRASHPDLDPSQVIVVDDGARAAAEAQLPGIRWIEGAKPFVFAANANLGIAASRRDIILLNDDALPMTAGGFDRLSQAALREPGLGAVSSAVVGTVGNGRQAVRPGDRLRPEPEQLCFICVYLPRATLDLVGPLDARFTGYGYDDNDYCDRIRAAGLRLAIYDGCVVDHSGRLPSTFRTRTDFAELAARNLTLYRQKRATAKAPAASTARPRVLCALRVRDEAAHIGEVLDSVLPLCGQAVVFDDHSEDATPQICAGFGARVERMVSPFTGLDEARDKNCLLRRILVHDPDWVLWIDGDEVLERAGPAKLAALIARPDPAEVLALQIAYLWDDPAQVRVDGVFGRFTRQSLFRLRGQPVERLLFPRTGRANLHCGNVPRGLVGRAETVPVRLKHYGYLAADQRRRKYEWYNRVDPGNRAEDEYRHLIGVPGARHAPGPLVLEPWDG